MHEQSETIQNQRGKWENVYGKKTSKAGQRLPDTPEYDSVEEAVKAAKQRSKNYKDYGVIDQDIIHKRK